MTLLAIHRLVVTLVCVLPSLSTVAAPPPIPRGALSLNVRQEQISSSGTNWRTAWGSFDTDYANKRVLVATIKRFGNFQPSITIYYYFIGRSHSTKKLLIYDSGQRDAVTTTAASEILVASQTVRSNRSRENTPSRSAPVMSSNGNYIGQATIAGKTGPTVSSGITPYGWCLIVKQGDREVAEAASVPELITWTKQKIAEQGK